MLRQRPGWNTGRMVDYYFSENPAGEARSRVIDVELAGATRSILTAGGVFSPEQIDRGTHVLLRELAGTVPANITDPFLDIGCGWGPIALTAALEIPEREVWAVDVNERARELTRENAKRLGLRHLHVAAPDAVPKGLTFGEIRSNPPIRVGKSVLHEILTMWLPRLAPRGAATLVVAKHLGAPSLQAWMHEAFPQLAVSRIARSKGFHLIRAVRD